MICHLRSLSAITLAVFASSTVALAAPTRLSEVTGVNQAAFSHDGAQVIVSTREGPISLWNASTGAPIPGEINRPSGTFVTSRDGRHVLIAHPERGARVFDPSTGAANSPELDVQLRITSHPEAVFSPDRTRVLIFEPGAASIFDLKEGQRLAQLTVKNSTEGEEDIDIAPSAHFTQDGSKCFLMSAMGVVTVYDPTTWKSVGAPIRHPAAESAYTFGMRVSDDARWLATFDSPGENGPKAHLQVWDAVKGKALGKPLVAVNGMEGQFIPNTTRLLTMPGRGEASIRDLPALKKTVTIPAHDEVDGPQVAFSPDGKWVLSWGADRIVRLRESVSGKMQESQVFQARISQVMMLPDSSGCLIVFDNSAFLLQNHYDHYVLKLAFPDLKITHSLRITEYLHRAALSPNGARLLLQTGQTDQERLFIYNTTDFKPLAN